MSYPKHWPPAICAAHDDLVSAMVRARGRELEKGSSREHALAKRAHDAHRLVWAGFEAGAVGEFETVESMRLTEVAYRKAAGEKWGEA